MKISKPEHDDRMSGGQMVDHQKIRDCLLAWYDRSGRDLPWRRRRDAYAIWLSEMMLQQTQIQTVLPYYQRFLERWPDVADLAAATEEQVLKAWEGLGYYSRARHLHQAARIIAGQNGQFPSTANTLRDLPGIGAYTAGAIASIAFGEAVAAVDGNVVRVIARLASRPWVRGREADRRAIEQWLRPVIPPNRPGDFNQALMDLGATICLPSSPRCPDCPLRSLCSAKASGEQERYPLRRPQIRQTDEDKTILILCRNKKIRVIRQDGHGLLAGLYAFDWHDPAGPPVESAWPDAQRIDLGRHVHTFTHRRWHMRGWLILINPPCGSWPDSQEDKADTWLTRQQLTEIPMARALSVFRDRLLESDYCR